LKEKACKKCHFIVRGKDVCPKCGSRNLSANFSGIVIIIDPENSEIAKRLKINKEGRYALRVR